MTMVNDGIIGKEIGQRDMMHFQAQGFLWLHFPPTVFHRVHSFIGLVSWIFHNCVSLFFQRFGLFKCFFYNNVFHVFQKKLLTTCTFYSSLMKSIQKRCRKKCVGKKRDSEKTYSNAIWHWFFPSITWSASPCFSIILSAPVWSLSTIMKPVIGWSIIP